MAGSTTNLSLIKPTYSEDADIADINTNMDTLDSKIGPVGGTSLQAQVSKILPVISGTTNNSGYAISAGEYFEANGALYKASASIPTGNAWSSSATAQSDHGAVNALNTALSPLISDAISVSDCNNAIDQNKVYYCNSTATHSPGAYYYMIRPLYKSGNYITQIATGMNAASPTIMIRSCVNGTWGSWDECALNSNLNLKVNRSGINNSAIIAADESTNALYFNVEKSNGDLRQFQLSDTEFTLQNRISGAWSRAWTIKIPFIVTDTFSLSSKSPTAHSRIDWSVNVSKTGYTPLGIVQVDFTDDYIDVSKFSVYNGTAYVSAINNTDATRTTTGTIVVLYLAS